MANDSSPTVPAKRPRLAQAWSDNLARYRALGRNARLYLLSNTIQGLSLGATGLLYPLFLTGLGYKTDFIGLLTVLATLGGAAGILPAGPLVDRFGWRTMLLVSNLGGGAAVALQLLVPTAPVLIVTSLIIGASVAIVLVVNAPLLAANSTPRERTALFGLNSALGLLAGVAGTLLGGLLPVLFLSSAVRDWSSLIAVRPLLVAGDEARAYQLSMLVVGALVIPSIIPVFLLHSDGGRGTRGSTAAASSAEPADGSKRARRLDRKRLAAWMRAARAMLVGVIGRFSATQAFVAFGAGLFLPYLSIYFVRHLGASPAAFGALSSALQIAQATAIVAAAGLADRFGKVRLAVAAQVVSIPFLLLLGAAPLLGPALLIAGAAYFIRGSVASTIEPVLQVYLMESVPDETRGRASEVYNITWQVANAGGTWAGGLVSASYGFGAIFLLAGACYATGALLVARWLGEKNATRSA